jgi:hypothetical protein
MTSRALGLVSLLFACGCSSSEDAAAPALDDAASDSSTTDSGVTPEDTGSVDAASTDVATSMDAGPPKTKGGVLLPSGWTLKGSDRFGTAATQNVKSSTDLHAKYYEAQFYNREADGRVRMPNVVINHEQQTYSHFEDAIVFADDHLTIQSRGHADGSITSGEIVSHPIGRSFCVEARYRIPDVDKAWPAFWLYGDAEGHDASEIDVEQPVYADNKGSHQDVHQVSLFNHPDQGTLTVVDPKFTSMWMTWTDPAFDASSAPHVYTICYDDAASQLTRFIDGGEIYSSVWKWNASLGGTGKGPDPSVIVNVAVGGDWPGNTPNATTFSADFDLYWIDTWGP